jgi:hypothetical protein
MECGPRRHPVDRCQSDTYGWIPEWELTSKPISSVGERRDILGVSTKEMIYVRDDLFIGGNDYPAEQAGVISIPVRSPDETKRVIEAIIACLSDDELTWPFEVDR